ncbi:MFS transporter [Nocardia sp. alder85J]|uniref:MFS transporter n=1 Tax=Nocardia sp. alder85J TaxID=2862949 RepID=UPI001CD36EE2|nr:MFS transporter [Nocardia sp. alder85J]MCX4095574.1 MFS transporter [Nocardia sp. alder85J]
MTDNVQIPPATLRRIAVAGGIGTVIEYYDFFIFATAAALVFPKVFFPALGSAAGTAASFATLGVAFVARPVGSILFGHFGDRLGRKRTLVATLLTMGLATAAVGIMPTANSIGVIAPIVVVALRFLQGLAVGGEWAGATLMAAESAPAARRGFWSVFGSFGGSVGLVLANSTFLITGATMSDHDFETYGWRIPFLTSLILVGVGLIVRLRIEETRVFTAEVARHGAAPVPLTEAIRRQPREVLYACGLLVMVFAFYYIAVSYFLTYGTSHLHLSRTTVLALSLVPGVVFGVSTAASAWLSDRVGRKRLIAAADAIAVPWALLLFPIVESGGVVTYSVCATVTVVIAGVAYGPVGAFLPELFATRYRYTASGVTYNVAGILGAAVPPVIAAPITVAYGSATFGVFLAVLCAISLAAVLGLPDNRPVRMDSGSPATESDDTPATLA